MVYYQRFVKQIVLFEEKQLTKWTCKANLSFIFIYLFIRSNLMLIIGVNIFFIIFLRGVTG